MFLLAFVFVTIFCKFSNCNVCLYNISFVIEITIVFANMCRVENPELWVKWIHDEQIMHTTIDITISKTETERQRNCI